MKLVAMGRNNINIIFVTTESHSFTHVVSSCVAWEMRLRHGTMHVTKTCMEPADKNGLKIDS